MSDSRWEIDIDAVYLDGERLPESTVPTLNGVDSTRTSALIDTVCLPLPCLCPSQLTSCESLGKLYSSWSRRCREQHSKQSLSLLPTFQRGIDAYVPLQECSYTCISNWWKGERRLTWTEEPHEAYMSAVGQMFPIDPRDFIGQFQQNDATTCVADNLVTTDAPRFGALFRWSLGDPFFRSYVPPPLPWFPPGPLNTSIETSSRSIMATSRTPLSTLPASDSSPWFLQTPTNSINRPSTTH